MTDQERNQVLKMIDEGKITPEQGLQLMQALEQYGPDGEPTPTPVIAPVAEESQNSSSTQAPEHDPHIERHKATARRLWQIPLWAGIFITVLSALGMYAIMHGPGMNFWFYFMLLPLLLGVALTGLAASSQDRLNHFVRRVGAHGMVQRQPGLPGLLCLLQVGLVKPEWLGRQAQVGDAHACSLACQRPGGGGSNPQRVVGSADQDYFIFQARIDHSLSLSPFC